MRQHFQFNFQGKKVPILSSSLTPSSSPSISLSLSGSTIFLFSGTRMNSQNDSCKKFLRKIHNTVVLSRMCVRVEYCVFDALEGFRFQWHESYYFIDNIYSKYYGSCRHWWPPSVSFKQMHVRSPNTIEKWVLFAEHLSLNIFWCHYSN